MEQRTAVAGVVNTPTLATSLIDGDQILVTLTAEKPDKSRVSLSHVFNNTGNQVDNVGHPIVGARALNLGVAGGGVAEPQFPVESYRAALRRGQQGGANDGEADRIIATYKDAMEGYQGQGGTTTAERIARSVMAFLEAEHNVRQTDHQGLILKPEQVVVKAPFRPTPQTAGAWLIQLAPTWGF